MNDLGRHLRIYTQDGMHETVIKSNALKAVRYALAVNFTRMMSNLHKAYRIDLFHLWSMEKEESINMGVQCRKWLSTQSKDNVPYVFIGPLVTALCHGLALGGKLGKVESDCLYDTHHHSRSFANQTHKGR